MRFLKCTNDVVSLSKFQIKLKMIWENYHLAILTMIIGRCSSTWAGSISVKKVKNKKCKKMKNQEGYVLKKQVWD